MKVGDRVWFTGTAQLLWDSGYRDPSSTWLMHCYGIITEIADDNALVSFHMFCDYEAGYTPHTVWVPLSLLKPADLTPEYIEESEGVRYTCIKHGWIARTCPCADCIIELDKPT